MINAVGRDIPEEILEMTGKEVFQGNHYRDGYVYKKDGPYTKCVVNNTQSKLVANIHDVLIKCGIKDGMTLGFHHHFREGDYIVNMVMEEVHKMGIKDITICASSLGKAHDPIVPYIEDGTITNIQSSGVRGKIGEAISAGKLKGLAIMRSHGGRVRAIESGETGSISHLSEHLPVTITATAVVSAARVTVACFPTLWWMVIMQIR